MSTTRDRLKNRQRPARPVTIDGAEQLHARELTLAELREVDRRAEAVTDGPEREVRRVELMALFALAGPDGTPTFPERSDEDLVEVGDLTPTELRAVAEACVLDRADAKKRLAADPGLLWVLRLSLQMGRTPAELLDLLTPTDLALYQALVEIDGPWWGEREAAMMRQLCSVQAAVGGADIPAERFAIEWTVGASAEAPGENLLPAADGLAIFAARHGLDAVEETP